MTTTHWTPFRQPTTAQLHALTTYVNRDSRCEEIGRLTGGEGSGTAYKSFPSVVYKFSSSVDTIVQLSMREGYFRYCKVEEREDGPLWFKYKQPRGVSCPVVVCRLPREVGLHSTKVNGITSARRRGHVRETGPELPRPELPRAGLHLVDGMIRSNIVAFRPTLVPDSAAFP